MEALPRATGFSADRGNCARCLCDATKSKDGYFAREGGLQNYAWEEGCGALRRRLWRDTSLFCSFGNFGRQNEDLRGLRALGHEVGFNRGTNSDVKITVSARGLSANAAGWGHLLQRSLSILHQYGFERSDD